MRAAGQATAGPSSCMREALERRQGPAPAAGRPACARLRQRQGRACARTRQADRRQASSAPVPGAAVGTSRIAGGWGSERRGVLEQGEYGRERGK